MGTAASVIPDDNTEGNHPQASAPPTATDNITADNITAGAAGVNPRLTTDPPPQFSDLDGEDGRYAHYTASATRTRGSATLIASNSTRKSYQDETQQRSSEDAETGIVGMAKEQDSTVIIPRADESTGAGDLNRTSPPVEHSTDGGGGVRGGGTDTCEQSGSGSSRKRSRPAPQSDNTRQIASNPAEKTHQDAEPVESQQVSTKDADIAKGIPIEQDSMVNTSQVGYSSAGSARDDTLHSVGPSADDRGGLGEGEMAARDSSWSGSSRKRPVPTSGRTATGKDGADEGRTGDMENQAAEGSAERNPRSERVVGSDSHALQSTVPEISRENVSRKRSLPDDGGGAGVSPDEERNQRRDSDNTLRTAASIGKFVAKSEKRRHHRHRRGHRNRSKGVKEASAGSEDDNHADGASDALGQADKLKLLLEFIPYYGTGDTSGDNMVRSILSAADPQELAGDRDEYENTLLILACQYRCKGLVPIILARGGGAIDVNAVNSSGACALHFTCYKDSICVETTMLLLEHGAQPEVVENTYG